MKANRAQADAQAFLPPLGNKHKGRRQREVVAVERAEGVDREARVEVAGAKVYEAYEGLVRSQS